MYSSICLKINNKLIANYIQNSGFNHSETLLPNIHNILKLNKISIKNIDTFIITNGPGSFTGVRIAISTIYGLTIANKLSKYYAISTLHAMAKQYNHMYSEYFFIPILKANSNKVFNAVFFNDKNNDLNIIYNDRVIEIEKIIDEFYDKPCIILGYSHEFTSKVFDIHFKNFYFINLDNTSNAYSLIKILESGNVKNKKLIDASYLIKFL